MRTRLVLIGILCGGLCQAQSLEEYAASMVQPKNWSSVSAKETSVQSSADCSDVSEQSPSADLASYNPNAGVLWPGALIQWSSLATGTLADVPESRRAPITFYISDAIALRPKPGAPILTPNIQRTVHDVRGSNVEQELVGLLQEQFFTAPSFFWTKVKSYSVEQSLLDVGIDAHWMTGSVKASLKSSDYVSKSNYLVKLTQSFYTVAVDPPRTPGGWFYKGVLGVPSFNGVSVADLQPYSSATNPITFVRSIVYGRQIYLSISSTEKDDAVSAAIDVAMNWATAGGTGHFDDSTRKILQESEIKLWVYGGGWDADYDKDTGGAKAAVALQDPDKLALFAKYLKPSGKEDVIWGRPLSYRADYIGNDTPASVNMSTTFRVCKVVPQSQNMAVTLQLYTPGGDDKDHDSTINFYIRSNSGVEFAKSEGIGRDEHWDDNGSTHGPFTFTPEHDITRDAAQSGLKLWICMDNDTNDTMRYNLNFAADATRPKQANAVSKPWTLSVKGQSISQRSCKTYDLPAFPAGL